jgi:hypothetical protein
MDLGPVRGCPGPKRRDSSMKVAAPQGQGLMKERG